MIDSKKGSGNTWKESKKSSSHANDWKKAPNEKERIDTV